MGRVRLLKQNGKAVYMLITILLFALAILSFSLLMYFSPTLTNENIKAINNLIENNSISGQENKYKLFLKAFWINGQSMYFAVNKVLYFWIPMVVSGCAIIVIFYRIFVHSIGYKPRTNKNIPRIVRPIRSYQATVVLMWLFFIFLIISFLMAYFSLSPFLSSIAFQFGLKNFVNVDYKLAINISNKLNNQFNKVYWLTYPLLTNSKNIIDFINNDSSLIIYGGWFIIPILAPFLITLFSFMGMIAGECSWWKVNLIVLKVIDSQAGTNLVDEYQKVEAPKVIDKKLNKLNKAKKDDEIELNKNDNLEQDGYINKMIKKCNSFYKNILKMLEDSNNNETNFYNDLKSEKENIFNKDQNNWNEISREIVAKINILTHTEQQFVNLIEQLIKNPKIDLFGRYTSDLQNLIDDYRDAIKSWNLLESEIKLEQIFAITFKKIEILPKVGYCLKDRVRNNWKHIDQKKKVLTRLEEAKLEKDYTQYREICAEVIEDMSPIKPIIKDYVGKIIYN